MLNRTLEANEVSLPVMNNSGAEETVFSHEQRNPNGRALKRTYAMLGMF